MLIEIAKDLREKNQENAQLKQELSELRDYKARTEAGKAAKKRNSNSNSNNNDNCSEFSIGCSVFKPTEIVSEDNSAVVKPRSHSM